MQQPQRCHFGSVCSAVQSLLSHPGGGGIGQSDRSALTLGEEHSSITAIPSRLSVMSTAPSQPLLPLLSRPGGGGGLRSKAPSKPLSTHLYRARITALRSRMQCGVQAAVHSCRGNKPSCLHICTTQHSERRSIGSASSGAQLHHTESVSSIHSQVCHVYPAQVAVALISQTAAC